MPTNTFSAIVLAASWLTNSPPVADDPRGDVWFQTNIVSFRSVVAVVGPGIPAMIYTNATMSTNVIRCEIVKTIVPVPIVSMVVTSQWPAVSLPPPLPLGIVIQSKSNGTFSVTTKGAGIQRSEDGTNWNTVSNTSIHGDTIVGYDWRTNGSGLFKAK